MLHGFEEEPGTAHRTRYCGSSRWKRLAVSVRMKRCDSPASHWLHILLLILLAGQASASTLALRTETAPGPALYMLDVSVDVSGTPKDESEIQDWISQVFTENLGSCVSPAPSTTASTPNSTTLTTTAATTSQSNTTTQSTTVSTTPVAETTNTTGTSQTTTITTPTSPQSTSPSTLANTTTNSPTTQSTSTSTSSDTTEATPTTTTQSITTSTVRDTTTPTTTTTTTKTPTTQSTSTSTSSDTTEATPTTTQSITTSTVRDTTTPTTTTTKTPTTQSTSTSTSSDTTEATTETTVTTQSTTTSTPGKTTEATTTKMTTTQSTTTSTPGETTEITKTTTTPTFSTSTRHETTKATTERTTTPIAKKTTATTLRRSTKTTTAAPTTQKSTDGVTTTLLTKTTRRVTKRRVVRQIHDSWVIHRVRRAATVFGGLELSCKQKKNVKKTQCTVTMSLTQVVPPCCILRTLCAASKTSDIRVVGKRAERIRLLDPACSPLEKNRCIYNGPSSAACDATGPSYVENQGNLTSCKPDVAKNCSCSTYCSKSDAFYTFQVSILSPDVNIPYVLSTISKINEAPSCSVSTDPSCPSSILSSLYKDAKVVCESEGEIIKSCQVIVHFAQEVPICNVSAAVTRLLGTEEQIGFTGLVTRAAICGNTGDNPLTSQFTSEKSRLKPSDFCGATGASLSSPCESDKNVLVELGEQCVHSPTTTLSPNVTTTTPNVTMTTTLNTTTTANVTSTTLNTTAEPLNTTTASPNVTTTTGSNTTTTLNGTTTSANMTTTLNATTTSANMTTTLNATTANTTGSPLNATTIAANTTESPLNATTTASNNTMTTTLNATTTANTTTNGTKSAESQAEALLDQTRDVSNLNSSQVEQLVSELEDLLSGPNVSLALGNTSIHIVSNLLGASPEALAQTSDRIIGIVDTVGLKLVLVKEPETLLSPAVVLSVKPADGTNFQETFFAITNPTNVLVRGDHRLRRDLREEDSSIPQGSIRLPPTLTQDLTTEQQQLVSRVQFDFYQKSTVFQDRTLDSQRKLNSGILGARVANLSITGLKDDVVIHLRNKEPVPKDFKATCVFWDFTFNDGTGGWNPRGCSVLSSTDNVTTCGCNHLTSFAILLDLSREPLTDRVQATILTFITYIGCGVSAIFLSITLLTYLSFGKLRKDIPSKILIQLCLALLLLNLVFLVDAWLALYPEAVGLCISTAWFLHYFLLVSFTWMGLEAVHMYLALVKVFNSYVSHYMLRFSFAGWGVPMVVVIIVIAIDKDNYGLVSYGKFDNGASDDFCWLKNDVAFYVAVVAYFCVVFLFNLMMFVVVLVQLCRMKKQNPHNSQHRSALQDARSVLGITILLGLTWGFAFFAWGPVNLAFMYLFAIFNSLQGFFIFIFHCAVKENVRRQWRTYLCCGRMRLPENSEWSRTATQKNVKKSSLTNLTSLHSSRSSRSNNSSSSTSFLVQQRTEPVHGIGSPFEDRAITADEDPNMDMVLNDINYRTQHTS